MSITTRQSRTRYLALIPCLALAFTGCQAIRTETIAHDDFIPPAPSMSQPPPGEPAFPNHCIVVLKDSDGAVKRVNITLEKETHIQELLTRSGAAKRYRRMDIQLIRTTPTGAKHRMGVAFDRSTRKVEMQSDYFVQPGDVLAVTEDASTILDDMLQRKAGAKGKGGIGGLLGG